MLRLIFFLAGSFITSSIGRCRTSVRRPSGPVRTGNDAAHGIVRPDNQLLYCLLPPGATRYKFLHLLQADWLLSTYC